MREALTSMKNPRIKEALELMSKRRARDEAQLFAVEGAREALRAQASGLVAVRVFFCMSLATASTRMLLNATRDAEQIEVAETVFAKLAMREGSDGVLVLFRQRHLTLKDLNIGDSPLILAVHGVEKPGNLGALLRSADGAGVDAVVLLDNTVDLFNPHVIRGSVGAIFGLQVVVDNSVAFLSYCRVHKIRIVAAALSELAKPHFEESYKNATAVLLGSEADGLPDSWIQDADACVKIPMQGIADSLNVSVAGAVLLYEARRQRS